MKIKERLLQKSCEKQIFETITTIESRNFETLESIKKLNLVLKEVCVVCKRVPMCLMFVGGNKEGF